MDVLNKVRFCSFVGLFLFSSCAKIAYLAEQGHGQFSLLTNSRLNSEVLKDKTIDENHKRKIRLIEKYKSHFYKFYEKESTDIYSKTTFLENEAVTYLVIASAFNEVRAKKECFPIMGCFPYLGFYKKQSARIHASNLEQKDYVTYTRPVYAYSTLGYFTDNILSSFFKYDDYALGELTFHELFHTIFFIKNEVELNENLANYFGKEMAIGYFELDEIAKAKLVKKRSDNKKITKEIVKFANDLDSKYKELVPKNKKIAKEILIDYKVNTFIPRVLELCLELKISKKKCFAAKQNWNNASLAAYKTYENKALKIEQLHKKLGLSLKDYYFYIERMYKKFEDEGSDDFTSFLFKSK